MIEIPKKFCGYRVLDATMTTRHHYLERGMEFKDARALRAGPFVIMVADNDHFDKIKEWRHVSITHLKRFPTFEEVLEARGIFFPQEVEVIQRWPSIEEAQQRRRASAHLWWCKTFNVLPAEMAEAEE